MASAAPTRAAIAGAHASTQRLIAELRSVLAELEAHGLHQTPTGESLYQALKNLLNALMQAGAFLDNG